MKKPAKITINPREPLTKKAFSAIDAYAHHEGKKMAYAHYFMLKYILQAERMRRSQLYAWLASRGYRWNTKRGIWEFVKK